MIIVTTVRSSADLLVYDAKFTLGFLSNPRRFNGKQSGVRAQSTHNIPLTVTSIAVAMTRAQALLIVIGDAAILSVDPLWRAFMNYVYLRHGWRGDTPTWDVHAPVDTNANYLEELREAIVAETSALVAQVPSDQDLEAEELMHQDVSP